MKSISYLLILLLASSVFAKPKPSDEDEAVSDSNSNESTPDSLHKETLMEKEDGSGSGMGPDDSGELSSEVLGFNLALFPGSSIFASPMLQKLQESLRLIRDQLNAMWSMNGDNKTILDVPDDYKNSTSQTRVINGTVYTINETISKSTDEGGVQSIYHVKVISVHPENGTDAAPQQLISQPKMDQEEHSSGEVNEHPESPITTST